MEALPSALPLLPGVLEPVTKHLGVLPLQSQEEVKKTTGGLSEWGLGGWGGSEFLLYWG